MACKRFGNEVMIRSCLNTAIRYYSGKGAPSPPAPVTSVKNVPGLSEKVILKLEGTLGPGVLASKTGDYKVPEYFCYDVNSYFEAEHEMAKYRLPQPSASIASK